MRLSHEEKRAIKEAVYSIDPAAQIYLFGSRADDTKRGGDIDLLIFSHKITFEEKLHIKTRIFQEIEEQKIDVVLVSEVNQHFVELALENSTELT